VLAAAGVGIAAIQIAKDARRQLEEDVLVLRKIEKLPVRRIRRPIDQLGPPQMIEDDTNILEPVEQAAKLRKRAHNEIDWENVAEEIAKELRRSKLTIKTQLAGIFRKLGVANRSRVTAMLNR